MMISNSLPPSIDRRAQGATTARATSRKVTLVGLFKTAFVGLATLGGAAGARQTGVLANGLNSPHSRKLQGTTNINCSNGPSTSYPSEFTHNYNGPCDNNGQPLDSSAFSRTNTNVG